MTWNLDAVGEEVPAVEHSWTSTQALLYSLGVGAGVEDPVGPELEFTTENSEGLTQKVLPTFGVAVAFNNAAFSLAGTFDPTRSVHGEQGISLTGPIPPEGRVITTGRLTGIYDKGSGAVVTTESRSVEATSGEPLFTTRSSLFVRGAGGFGGPRGPSARQPSPAARVADQVLRADTRRDQALLYRLSGDRNPLHSDPAFAATGWIRQSDPAWPLHLRLHRSTSTARPVRFGSGALRFHGVPFRRAGMARRFADGPCPARCAR